MDHLLNALFWLDAAPVRYWTLAWTLFAITSGMALRSDRANPQHQRWREFGFAATVVLTLFTFRWPSFFFRPDLNPDEAQIVAGALTLDHFHLLWKYLDTTTHGPLCEFGLVAAHWLGAPFNYVTARVLSVVLQAAALLAVWGALRRFTSARIARVGILPGVAFWSFVSWDNFLHYSSELPGIALLALAAWGLAVLVTTPGDRRPRGTVAFGVGLSLAAVPFGKLQSAPHAAVLLLLGAGFIWFMPSLRPHRLRLLSWLGAGLVTIAAVLAGYLQVWHLWHQFWVTYVVSAIAFLGTSEFPFSAMPGRFFIFSATAPAFAFFFWGSLAFAVLYWREPIANQPLRVARGVAWLLLGVAMFTVLRPGRESAHYLHLLVPSLTLLGGLTLGGAIHEKTPRPALCAAVLVFLALTLGPQCFVRVVSGNRFVGYARQHWSSPDSSAAQFITKNARPGDTMAMWGWEPHLLVEVQMPHATREAQSANQIMQWPLTAFFVDRYVQDLTRRRPTWFVDAVGPGAFIFDSRATQAHESVPALRKLVARNYTLLTEIGSMRIYHLATPFPSH